MFKCSSCNVTTKHHEPMYKKVTERYDSVNDYSSGKPIGGIKKEIALCMLCATGKTFEREIEVKEYIGFHKVVSKNPHNDRVQI